MKKYLLSLAAAFALVGFNAQAACTIDDLVGNDKVAYFSGLQYNFWQVDGEWANQWVNFCFDGYTLEVSKVGDNQIKITNLFGWSDEIVGTFDPEAMTITFEPQQPAWYIDEDTQEKVQELWCFCGSERAYEEAPWEVRMSSPVVGTVDANYCININDFTMIYPESGVYLWNTKLCLATAKTQPLKVDNLVSDSVIVDKWSGYQAYLWPGSDGEYTDDWLSFYYSDYPCSIEKADDGIVFKSMFGYNEEIKASVNEETGEITIEPQTITVAGQSVVICSFTTYTDENNTTWETRAAGNVVGQYYENGAVFINDITFADPTTGWYYLKDSSVNLQIPVSEMPEESGVANLNAATAASGSVFNVNGVCVLRNATDAQVNALAPGLYIVNGKKVFVTGK